tara:strand:+ start:2106 stop:2597 length:492 start_codon:yes stop_codon:yes gene_type:complete
MLETIAKGKIAYYAENTNMSQIRDNLHIANFKDVDQGYVLKHGITAILNVANEVRTPPMPDDIKIIGHAFKDDFKTAKKHGPRAAQKLIDLLEDGENVLVHCRAGSSRSPHVCALALSAIENTPYHEVYDEIKALHPKTMSYSIQAEIEDKGMGWLDAIVKLK